MKLDRKRLFWPAFAVAALLVMFGCEPPAQSTSTGTAHDHGHDHGHHDHADEGPNGGHLIELGDEQYHAEWLHDDDSGKVEVIILDGTAKQEVPVAADVVTITVDVEGDQHYALEPTNAENGLASRFEIVAPDLVTALKLGDGVEVTLDIEIDGTPFSSTIEHLDHDGHDH